mmetsp:Transcript_33020/g.43504  ORF Transcript_33020/g.43504 Transcript_33020/m.43504 type:complete len:100 (+) Transcript_33020:63-362(+)
MTTTILSGYKLYLLANETRPLLTKSVTAGTLMGLGDLLCQSIEKKFTGKTALDYSRLWSFTAYGFSVFGPLLYTTYNKVLPIIAPGKGWSSVGKKIFFT